MLEWFLRTSSSILRRSTYDADGNRSGITSDGAYSYGYSYTGRNQLQAINGVASYVYDARGNVLTRTLVANGRHSDYIYDTRDRVTSATHTLNGVTRTFTYGYHDNSDNRKFAKRTWTGLGEVFTYDQAEQVTAVQHNIANPDTTPMPGQNVYYDSNGNRIWYTPAGVNKHYDVNGTASNLNQYNNVTIDGWPYNLSYGSNANLAHYDKNNSSYSYDAQNRLTSATVGGQTMYFDYDGLNRQVSRRIGANGTRTFNVWDGWDLIEEYQGANNGLMTAFYLYGATGLIAGATNGEFHYYFQDGSGSTSHLTDGSGTVLEWYRYDVDGTPIIYDANNNQLSTSAKGVRHLFTGQQWYQELGLYDLRNRFYSPDLGRFLQPDPIGFRGGNNLYRYCRNNPITRWDPFGLQAALLLESTHEPIIVEAPPLPPPDPSNISRTGFLPGTFGGWPGTPWGLQAELVRGKEGLELRINPEPTSPSVEHPPPSSVPSQNPQAPVNPISTTPTAIASALAANLETFHSAFPIQALQIMIAYPRARELRIEGHRLFPEQVKQSRTAASMGSEDFDARSWADDDA